MIGRLFSPSRNLEITAIDILLQPDATMLERFAAKPFIVNAGPISAFTAPHDDPAIDAALID